MFIPLYDYNPLRHVPAPYVNYSIIAVTCLTFLLSGGFDEARINAAAVSYGLIPALVNDVAELEPEFLRIPEDASYLTYAFLHANIFHLLGNMLFLWVFGDNVEDACGHVRYLLFYLATAAAGGAAHAFIDPTSPAPLIGASGAVAGVVGAYLLLHPRVRLWVLAFGRIPLPLPAGIVLSLWAVFQVASLFVSVPGEENTAWWAHIGGFVAGALLILVLRRPGVPLFDRNLPERPPA